jgi:DNA-binding MarR family transcriptional regulator
MERSRTMSPQGPPAPRLRPGTPPGDHVDRLIAEWRDQRPDLDVGPVAVVNRITRLATHLNAQLDRVFAAAGITATDFAVLSALRRAGHPYALRQRRLIEVLNLTSGTVSVRIEKLVAAGLVHRATHPADARSSVVTLTRAGLELFDTVAPAHLMNEANLIAALRPDERQALATLLRTLLVDLEPPRRDRPDARLGLTLSSAHLTQRRRIEVGLVPTPGLLVDSVEAGGPAASAGVQAGDLLERIGDLTSCSLTRVHRALAALGRRRTVELHLRRGTRRLAVTLKPQPADTAARGGGDA